MRFSGTHGVRPMWLSEDAWLGWLVIIGSIPIGVIGLLFKKEIEGAATKNLWTIAVMMIVIAVFLAIAGSRLERIYTDKLDGASRFRQPSAAYIR